MRFFTKEIIDEDWDDKEGWKKFDEACRLNYIEYLKAKERLPKNFSKIYEKTERFDDDPVPYIGIISEAESFNYGVKGAPPSMIKMIIVDYDNHDLAWEIIISNIKEITANWIFTPNDSHISCINRDEIIIVDEKHVSWEIIFVGGLEFKVIFRNIRIRELRPEEIEIYKQPTKKG